MKKLITDFPDNITEAMQIAASVKLKSPTHEIKNVVICGMGGSGIGGSLVSKWLENELEVPIYIAKDYTLPGFVSKNSLVIGSSYSGNTEETLSSFDQAIDRGAHMIGITSGGKMKEICESNDFDVVIVPGGNPPRTALGFSIVQLINVFVQLGMAKSSALDNIVSARTLIVEEEETIRKEAMLLAEHLHGSVGILYAAADYEPVLVRARQQFNENSKMLCWHHVLPEMNHNELVGWGGGDDRFAVVFFDAEGSHPRNDKRTEITKSKVGDKSKVLTIKAKGTNIIERSIYIINLVDWASVYLSELKKVDPIDITVIDYLKSELAKFN
ncbi:MAG: bifunctional phosphoglucose/phosphomannose isomerase [Crocinitomicaceae bacterium]|nr:bifunctional phosphoglucose/phosphomannose isomerase [Crocinitomicaceae bacterium]